MMSKSTAIVDIMYDNNVIHHSGERTIEQYQCVMILAKLT